MDLTNTEALKVPKIKQAIADLVDDMKPIVKNIEHGRTSGTTQHNYGGYMTAFSAFKTTEPVMLFIIGNAMLSAGGNQTGIQSAIKVIGGI